jgi:hypothetical protein
MNDDYPKLFAAPLGIDSEFFIAPLPILYGVKEKPQQELRNFPGEIPICAFPIENEG